MFQTILAFFGYVKVPEGMIDFSIRLEDLLKRGLERHPDSESIKLYYEAAKALTTFLKKGKSINQSGF